MYIPELFSNMKRFNGIPNIDISRELESINFKELLTQFPELNGSKKELSEITRFKKPNRWFLNNKVRPADKKKDNEPKTQLEAFQQAMRLLFIIGQCLALNSVVGVLLIDVSKMRFSVFNWRFLYCFTTGIAQAIVSMLILYMITKVPLSVGGFGFVSFYLIASITTISFLYVGTKWPGLMKELEKSSLNEYIDRSVKTKCYTVCIVILILAAVEHILYLISNLTGISACSPNIDLYNEYKIRSFSWYYGLGLPDGKVIPILLQILNIMTTLTWNYSDVYICCLSFYLASILQEINKKVVLASNQPFLPPKYWGSLRKDYFKATQLVHSFDDVISGIVFFSLTSNLISICLQLFNVFRAGLQLIRQNNNNSECSKSGIFGGYEYTIYTVYSFIYLLARSLAVSLTAAYVHSASLAPATALYSVPSTSYCTEVSRFLNQILSDTVALSGLRFFYVTREHILTIVGIIVTYELVVFQVSNDDA